MLVRKVAQVGVARATLSHPLAMPPILYSYVADSVILCQTLYISNALFCSYRVEGRGKAVITDVIYSSETSSEEEKPSSESKEKYEALKVCVCV